MIRALVLVALLSAPAAAQQAEITTGDCSGVISGSDNRQTIICGYTIEQHQAALADREAQLRADLERTHTAEQRALQLQLADVERQRADLQASYEQTVAELAQLREKLSGMGGDFSEARIAEARDALTRGDRSKADALYAEAEQMVQEPVARAADAAFQRGLIALSEIRWADARAHFERSSQLAPGDVVLSKLAVLEWRLGFYEDAELTARRALRAAERRDDQEMIAGWSSHLGVYLSQQGRYAEAEALFRRAIDIDRVTIGTRDPDYAQNLNNFASFLQDLGKYAEAEPLYREVISIDEQTIGQAHPEYFKHLGNLASLLHDMERFDEAERTARRAISLSETHGFAMHPDHAIRLNNLATLLQDRYRFGEAEALYREALEIGKATLGPDHPAHATHLNNLGDLLREVGRFEEAEPLLRQSLAIELAVSGRDHLNYAIGANNLAKVLSALDRGDEARALYAESLAVTQALFGVDHPNTRKVAGNMSRLLREHFPDDPALAELEATFGSEIGK